jgi:hypothetical protein
MRIRLGRDRRLSVWERQNPEAVSVRLARSKPFEPVRRVLSMPGWMLLWVRYDWKDHSAPGPVVSQRASAFQEAADTLRKIDPVAWSGAADVCAELAFRAQAEAEVGL